MEKFLHFIFFKKIQKNLRNIYYIDEQILDLKYFKGFYHK